VTAFVLVFTLNSCDDDDNNTKSNSKTIAAIASETSDLSILVQALDRAGLTNTFNSPGEFTVFAPTNAAFQAFLTANNFASLDAVPVSVLTEVLKNHVLADNLKSTDLSTGYYSTLAKGSASSSNTLSMFINLSSGVVINGGPSNSGANVMLNMANIEASNGVVHVVDRVIGLPSVVNHAIANPSFSTLVSTLTSEGQPDFVSILSETGPFTIFAPTNDAFTALTAELTAMNFVPTAAQLTTVLQYHVISPANVLSTSLTNNMVVTPLAGGTFTINTTGGAKITDGSNRTTNIIAVDIQATNGVIHAVDRVLLPNLAE
ncbi:MAG: fasciclin domain-containing protein, partial [Pedobacter sp.]